VIIGSCKWPEPFVLSSPALQRATALTHCPAAREDGGPRGGPSLSGPGSHHDSASRFSGSASHEHHGVRDFTAPDLQPTLAGGQKSIAIGPRIFDLQSSKQLTAGSPRLRGEPCVQLLSDLRQRIRSPTAPILFRLGPRSWPHLAVFLSIQCEGPPRILRSQAVLVAKHDGELTTLGSLDFGYIPIDNVDFFLFLPYHCLALSNDMLSEPISKFIF
jgi:hypothetical protein